MKEKDRIFLKLVIIVVCVICLIWLIHKDETDFQLKQPKGEGIKTEDVFILAEEILDKSGVVESRNQSEEIMSEETTTGAQKHAELSALKQSLIEKKEEVLSYESYIEILGILEGVVSEELSLKGKYKDDFYVLKEDWYQVYDKLLARYGLQERVKKTEINILTENENLLAEKIGENCILTDTGRVYKYRSEEFKQHYFETVTAYMADKVLLTIRESKDDKFYLKNVWVMEKNEESIQFFWQGFEVKCALENAKNAGKLTREMITDLTFREGVLSAVKAKQERVSGKLLRISETELELQGEGTFEILEECRVYRLYEELREESLDKLQIGYDFADFVLEDGKVCAVLIMRKENMESIRVAIKTNQFAALYHDKIEIRADCDLKIAYGFYDERETEVVRAGEKIIFEEESDYLKGDRVLITPLVQSGKTEVLSLERNQGIPAYRGSLEIAKADEGLLLINELLLEEYLYSVVPSEMPASYQPEALKSQAICARTYAYQYLTAPGLGNIGANVDDSVSYQVYNNIAENVNSTKAVKETTGQMLLYEGEPVNTYYYSTSCGFGADAGVWQDDNAEKYPYLIAKHISEVEEEEEAMKTDDVMREYLLTVGESDYEKEEPWYRWSYKVDDLEVSVLYERLYSRYRTDNAKVLTQNPEAESSQPVFESKEPKEFEEIYDIVCCKRRAGGVIDELLLETDSGTYKIVSEYNVRYILNNGGSVTRQDGSEVKNGQLLPSAYLIIDTIKEKDEVTGFEIIGGGYGHGVGMSQNGAKVMAQRGMDSNEIMAFFYSDCELKKMY